MKPSSYFLTRAWKPTPEKTFIWVVTKTALRWVRSDLGTAALTREVLTLRCGLDAEAWDGPRCPDLAGKQRSQNGGLAHPRSCTHGAARGLLAQSAAACGAPERGTSVSYPFVFRLLQC
jgi:hypothetical protein